MTVGPKQVARHIFLSYASADREWALGLAEQLEAGGMPVWIDRKSIAGGSSWSAEIVRGIRECAALVLVGSPAAMVSPNVQQEIQLAWETQRPILPLILAEAKPPDTVQYALAGRQWIDLRIESEESRVSLVVRALQGLGVARGLASETGPEQDPDAAPIPHGSMIGTTTNLPTQATAFIGRESEVAAACLLLLRPDVRLLTLTGPGGVGKTRLALAVALRVLANFPDGVFLVPLATITDPTLVTPTIAQVLGFPGSNPELLLAGLQAFLGQKRLLLILDNFEQVDAAAPIVGTLLAPCPRIKVLITSRSALRTYGEQELPVEPLAVPRLERLQSIDQIASYDAIRLFADRARLVKPDFVLTPDNIGAVVEICRRLDGLPLAIELAAARVRLLPPAALLSRLENRLKLLVGGARDLPRRQQTLREAIAWSYDLLDEEDKRLFRQLCVFVGSFDLAGAEAVARDGVMPPIDVMNGVDSLISKSLVKPREDDGEPFFTLLETIREFGLERLAESGKAEIVRGAHADYYLKLSLEAEVGMMSNARVSWFSRIDRELGNLRAALAWALGDGNERSLRGQDTSAAARPLPRVSLGLRIATALYEFWVPGGNQHEGCMWLDRGLALTSPAERTGDRAKALWVRAVLASQQGQMATIEASVDEAIEIARELGDTAQLARGLMTRGFARFHQQRAAGQADLEEGVRLFRQEGRTWELAMALFLWGDGNVEYVDDGGARDRLGESIAMFRALGDPLMQTLPTVSLGRLAWLEGNYGAARSLVEEALAIRRESADRWPLAGALGSLADVVRCQGDQALAAPFAEESLALFREIGDLSGIAWVLAISGHLARTRSDYREAHLLFFDSLTLRVQQGLPQHVATSLAWLGGVAVALNQFERAAMLLGAAATRFPPGGARWSPADQASYERDQAVVRSSLVPKQFADAWNAGRLLTDEQAIEVARQSSTVSSTE